MGKVKAEVVPTHPPLAEASFVPLTWLLLAISLLSLAFGPPHLIESDAARLPLYREQLRLQVSAPPPPRVARAALIMDAASGRVVYQYNAHQRLPPGSTTKIMTAIVALEHGHLDDRVVITENHLQEGSIMGLILGDEVTVEDLLWGLLLASGNDAAMALAEQIGKGSIERFVAMMNQKAVELGLKDTHFTNPHGHDAPGHYSSAYDLALMARYALDEPLFAQMVATERHTVTANKVYPLFNTNQLLRLPQEAPGVDGVKTGFTDAAGDCLVASVTRGGRRAITVILGSEDRVAASIPLIDYAFSAFTWVRLPQPLFDRFLDDEGGEHRLALGEAPELMIAPWQRPYLQASLRIDKRQNPYVATVPVGAVRYTMGGRLLLERPVYLAP